MKASEMMARIDRKQENNIELVDKLNNLSTLEQNIYAQIVTELYEYKDDIVTGQDLYEITDFSVEDIKQLKVNGSEYTFGSALTQAQNTYYKKNGKLCINPTPTKDVANGLVIMYRWKPAKITKANYEATNLLLPEEYQDAYEFYVRAFISFEQKNAGLSNAQMAIANATIEEFTLAYQQSQDNKMTNSRWK